MIRFGQRDYQLGVFLMITSLVLDRVSAQLPSAWKPKDAVTFFCERWYHQCLYALTPADSHPDAILQLW